MSASVGPESASKGFSIRVAQPNDVPELVRLINAAFVVEQPFIEGERIDPAGVRGYLEKGKFLVAEDPVRLAGCIYVELGGERGYLSLLEVAPPREGAGLGRTRLVAQESHPAAARG